MDFKFTEEQKMFHGTMKQFAEKEIAPLVEEAERNETFPIQIFKKMGDLGYLCVGYSPEYGGAGLGKVGECIVAENVERVCAGIGGSIIVQSGVATWAIHTYGSEAQKREYLMPAIKGRKIASFALTEPNAGSDAASIETRANQKDNHYVIDGRKIFITNSPVADFLVTAAITDKDKGSNGISLFIVEKGTPGLEVTKLKMFCLRSSEKGEVAYDGVRVPQENLIGERGSGFKYLMESLSGGRIALGASRLGLATAAFEASLNYAKERRQFGKPIAKFQSVAFMLSRMAMDIEAAKWLVYHAAWLYDEGERCVKEAAMAKLFASEAAVRITGDAMEIHGGYAFTAESPLARFFRDARVGTVVEGTSEIQQIVISREIGAA